MYIQYNLQFEKLCNILKLGEIVSSPKSISGGLLHRMYAMETTQGKYAIKALNPQIMIRSTAMQNYVNSERVANIALNTIPAPPVIGENIKYIGLKKYMNHQYKFEIVYFKKEVF